TTAVHKGIDQLVADGLLTSEWLPTREGVEILRDVPPREDRSARSAGAPAAPLGVAGGDFSSAFVGTWAAGHSAGAGQHYGRHGGFSGGHDGGGHHSGGSDGGGHHSG